MRAAVAERRMPLVRAALVGSGLAAAWVVVSLLASPSSASAEERPDGLLGTVGSVVGVVDGTLDAVVDEVVEPVAEVVVPSTAEVVEVVDEAAPAPAQPVIDAVPVTIDEATDAAGGTLDDADGTLTGVVSELGSAVADLAGGAPVGELADPVIDGLDGLVGGVPVVGAILGDETLGGLLGPVVDLADDTLGAVVGRLGPLPSDGVLPSLPDLGVVPEVPGSVVPVDWAGPTGATAGPGDSTSGVSPAAPSGLLVRTGTGPSLDGPPGAADPVGTLVPTSPSPADGAPLGSGAPAGGSASAGSGSGAAGGSDAAFAAHSLDALASLVLGSVDDALPSSPVFETDTTPD